MPAANFEDCKTLAASSISAAYAAVGAKTTKKVRVFLVSNATQGDLYITWDNSKDMFPVLSGSAVLIDVATNRQDKENPYCLPVGTQFYCKQITAPIDKAVYVSCLY